MAKKKSSRKKARNQREIDNRRDWHALLQCITVIAQMDPWDMLAPDDTCACLAADGSQMIFFSCVKDDEQGLIVFPFPARDGRDMTGGGAGWVITIPERPDTYGKA